MSEETDFFSRLSDWIESVSPLVQKNIAQNGNSEKWICALEKLQETGAENCLCFVEDGRVVISAAHGNSLVDNSEFRIPNSELLRAFMPWRKGPWRILGTDIDTEWRSDKKWDRFAEHVDFKDKKILDVGCGNGYYAYRCALSGAKFVLGVDLSVYSYFQSQIPAKLCPQIPVKILPLAQENLPEIWPIFDLVFSMGVLYHHKNPRSHLSHIYALLAENGRFLLETLIIDDPQYPDGLTPKGRYAKMRNVYEIPSIKRVRDLLASVGFSEIRLLDVCKTTNAEQRKTEWMIFESLDDFLDKNDPSKTAEGYPAPTRAVFWARR